MTDAKAQEGETENPFSFFRTPWFKDAISQLCADGWPTFIVPLNIKINECEEAYEALKKENEALKLQVKLLSEKTFNDVQKLKQALEAAKVGLRNLHKNSIAALDRKHSAETLEEIKKIMGEVYLNETTKEQRDKK